MLTNKQKASLLNSEIIATIKKEIKVFRTLKDTTGKAYKDYYKANEEANNFYWKTGETFKAYEHATIEERGAKREELWAISHKLEKAHTVARHNEKLQARYICDLFASLLSLDWWNLKDRKGDKTLCDLLSQETGARFGLYCDGGSIKAEQENSYIYYNFYFEGFRRWHCLRGAQTYEAKAPKMLTVKQYEKLKAKADLIVKTTEEQLTKLIHELESEQVRDLIGQWHFVRDLHKLED